MKTQEPRNTAVNWPRLDDYQVEVLLTLALAMGLYALADALHLPAPIAVVVAGLFVGNRGRAFAMTEQTREHPDAFWELIDELLMAGGRAPHHTDSAFGALGECGGDMA